jgi:hypothetical protein
MEQFRVSAIGDVIYVHQPEKAFKMSVQKERKLEHDLNTAILEATLYKEEGVFIPNCNYVFEAVAEDNRPLDKANIDDFKSAVDFFFTSILNTDLYIKSIPKCSSLCDKDLKKFLFEKCKD